MNTDRNALIELRRKTSAGMLDCLKVLSESGGDIDRAAALLKERGIAAVEARSDRETTEGRVFVRATASQAAMAQIACETDFAARSAPFLAAGEKVLDRAFAARLSTPDAETESHIVDLGRVVKENVSLKRLTYVECKAGERLSAYLHGEGAIGVILRWTAKGSQAPTDARLDGFFHDMALHVAAFAPVFLDEGSVPADYLHEKAESFRAEIEADPSTRAKPPAMREAIAAGKTRKHIAGVCLLSQGFVRDEKIAVAETLRRFGAETGLALAVTGFDRFEVGQG